MSPRLIWGPRPGRRRNRGRFSDGRDADWEQMYGYCVCLYPDQDGTVEFEDGSDALTDAQILEKARAALSEQGQRELQEPAQS